MKKIVFLLVCLFSMTIVKADNDKPIEMNQLTGRRLRRLLRLILKIRKWR